MKRIWVTGFRGFELGLFGNNDPKKTVLIYALKRLLTREIEDGADWLITGGQMGIEQLAIEAAIELKQEKPTFQTAMMLPFTDFGSQWNEANQAKLAQLKTQVDFTANVSQEKYSNPVQFRNYQTFMLEHTDAAILFYDEQATESTIKYTYAGLKQYAETKPYPITLVDFDRLQEFADEYAETLQDW